MTKFGMGVSIVALIVVIGAGVLILNRPVAIAPVEDNSEVLVDNTTPEPIPTAIAEFDKAIAMNIGDKATFADGLSIELKEINDSRCKPDVQCVWQGELAAVLMAKSGSFGASSREIRIGTVMNKSVTSADYKFTLASATEKSANIIVSKTNSTSRVAAGYVVGHVTIGPFCPVEREGQSCPVPPEAYSSREVIVYKSDKVTISEKGKIDAAGNYRIALQPGNYFIQIKPAGIGEGEKKPATIKPFEATTVNFDIDTGIR